MTDPDDGIFTSVYDDDGRLTKLTNPLGEVTSFTFDAAGQNTGKDLDNGTRVARTTLLVGCREAQDARAMCIRFHLNFQ